MYELPERFDLDSLVGTTIDLVSLAEYSMVIYFSDSTSVQIFSGVSLGNDGAGSHETVRFGKGVRVPEGFEKLIGRRILRVSSDDRRDLNIEVEGGLSCTVLGDDSNYECFTIPGRGDDIIV